VKRDHALSVNVSEEQFRWLEQRRDKSMAMASWLHSLLFPLERGPSRNRLHARRVVLEGDGALTPRQRIDIDSARLRYRDTFGQWPEGVLI